MASIINFVYGAKQWCHCIRYPESHIMCNLMILGRLGRTRFSTVCHFLSPAGFEETQKGGYKIASVSPCLCASVHMSASMRPDFAEAISLLTLH